MDYTVHGVAKSQMGLSDFHFHFHFRCKSKLYLVDSFLKQNILWECKESVPQLSCLGCVSFTIFSFLQLDLLKKFKATIYTQTLF